MASLSAAHASTGMGVKFVDVSHANLLTIDRFLKNMTGTGRAVGSHLGI
jgi:hypothetical protein